MKKETHDDSIPAPVQDLIKLFGDHLSSVVFPDVSREILESLAAAVETKTRELQEALVRAESAREDLEASRTELQRKAARALAYAKIFAEGDEGLQEKLSGINVGKAPRERKADRAKSPEPEALAAQTVAVEEKPAEKKPRSSRKSGKDAEAMPTAA